MGGRAAINSTRCRAGGRLQALQASPCAEPDLWHCARSRRRPSVYPGAMATKQWPHPPGTLRALIAVYGGQQFVICRPCRCYMPIQVPAKHLDRQFDPCPFRCTICRQRGEIVDGVPKGFHPVGPDLAPSAGRPTF
jgi:hypothetical protein